MNWETLPTGDILKFVAWVCNKAQSTYFSEYEQFVQLTNIEDGNLLGLLFWAFVIATVCGSGLAYGLTQIFM